MPRDHIHRFRHYVDFSKSGRPESWNCHDSRGGCSIISRDGRNILKISSAFGEQNHRVEAEEFDGAGIEASFGSVRLDLRNAIFNEDVEVRVKASFAGVGIYVPKDVNVDVRSNSAFGGVNNKTADRLRQQSGSHTILIIAECSFAGVEVM